MSSLAFVITAAGRRVAFVLRVAGKEVALEQGGARRSPRRFTPRAVHLPLPRVSPGAGLQGGADGEGMGAQPQNIVLELTLAVGKSDVNQIAAASSGRHQKASWRRWQLCWPSRWRGQGSGPGDKGGWAQAAEEPAVVSGWV